LFERRNGWHKFASRGSPSIRKVNTVNLAAEKARGDGLLGFVVRGSHVPRQSQSELLSISISFEDVLYRSGTEDFWRSFGKVIVTAAAECGRELPIELTTPISSRIDLKSYFCKASWDRDVVLLLDEFSYLYQANDNVRDDCLLAFRGLKQNCQSHAVKCLIAAGTFSIVYLNPSTSGVSPFNVADIVQCPSFTIDETRKLFLEFAKDLGYSIDDAIVEDVWAKSNGLVAQLDWCIVPKML
jgi:hypothetical protein